MRISNWKNWLLSITNQTQVKFIVIPTTYLLCIFSKGTHNTDDFVNWISGFIHGDFFNLYHVIPHQGVLASDSLMVPYPPFSLYLLGISGKVLTLLFGDTKTVILVASNLTSVLFTFLTAVVLHYWGRSRKGFSATFYLLTPAVFLLSPILGYQDSIMSFFILATLISAEQQKYFITGLLAACAVFSKQLAVMPIFGLALLIFFSLNWRAIYKSALGFLLGFLAILSPFIFTGTLPAYFRAQGLASVHTMMSAQNPNIPWLFSLIARTKEYGFSDSRSYSSLPLRITDDNLRQFLYLSFGAITVIAILAWVLFWVRRVGVQNISAIYAGAIAISAYNLLSFGVHENHFFMALPLLFAISTTAQNKQTYFFAGGALTLNLLGTGGLGRSIGYVSPLTQISGVLYTLISAVSLTLYVLAMWQLMRTPPALRVE
jgi:Gpi18-like mannosyltransferase